MASESVEGTKTTSSGSRRLILGVVLALVGVAAVAAVVLLPSLNPPRPLLVVEGDAKLKVGKLPLGEYQRRSWKLRNTGQAPVTVATTTTSDHTGFSLLPGLKFTIAPGEALDVQMTWPVPDKPAASFVAYAEVSTTDPNLSSCLLTVEGNAEGEAAAKKAP
jgi:hypothetical protein